MTNVFLLKGHSSFKLKHAWVLSRVWLFVMLWTIARQAPLSMGFSREEYWSRLPFPPPGHLPSQGWNPCPLHQQADSFPRVLYKICLTLWILEENFNEVLTLSCFKKKTNLCILLLRTGNSHWIGSKHVWMLPRWNCQVCYSQEAFILKEIHSNFNFIFLLFLEIHFNISHVLKY